ncbi:MAG: ABC transporter permease [Phycisphaerae bacterium]|nr:ABC transporter permease [Phycisphaerae bacterium]
MWHTLIIREIKDTLLNTSAMVLVFLCVLIIPLGLYVNCQEFEGRWEDFLREHQDYRSRYADRIAHNVGARGFRPPSPLSIFCSGVDFILPDQVVTSRSGLFRSTKEPVTDSPHTLLLGRVDYTYSMTFVVSLAALTFTFGCISTEKERGTLSLLNAYPLPRAVLLSCKVIGRYAALLVPLVVAIVVGLVVVDQSSFVSLGDPAVGLAILVIFIVTLLFVFCMVCLGVCVSACTHQSINSMVIAFMVWTVMILGIPRLSPMMAKALYPIDSSTTLRMKKKLAVEDHEKAYVKARETLMEACFSECGAPEEDMRRSPPGTEEGKKAVLLYDQRVVPILETHQKRMAAQISQLEQDYSNNKNVQNRIALALARLSPATSFTCILATVCGTGIDAPDNFNRNAQRFQDQVTHEIYDQVILRQYKGLTRFLYAEGFNSDNMKLPDMTYAYPTLTESLQKSWLDILLLALYTLLYFGIALVRFNQYDVR